MSSDVPPPELDLPTGWQLVSEESTTPFDARLVRITATTRIYEDTDLRERLAETTGTETTWRFVFASRLRIRPVTPPSRTLTRLVSDRTRSRFVAILEERGFDAVDRADTHRISIPAADAVTNGSGVTATRYRARVRVGARDLPVEAYFAVWPSGSEFLLGGGAYPLSVPDPETFDPEGGREELFEMLRSIR